MDIALIIRSELFLITLTFLLFGVFSWIQKKSGNRVAESDDIHHSESDWFP